MIWRLATVCPGFTQITLLKVFRWGRLPPYFIILIIPSWFCRFLIPPGFPQPSLGSIRKLGEGVGETEARSLAIMRSDKIFVWANERLGPPSPLPGGIPGSPVINIPLGSPPPQARRSAGKCGFLNIYRGCGSTWGEEEGKGMKGAAEVGGGEKQC